MTQNADYAGTPPRDLTNEQIADYLEAIASTHRHGEVVIEAARRLRGGGR